MTDEEVQFLLSVGFIEFGRSGGYICDGMQDGRVMAAVYDVRTRRWNLTEIDETGMTPLRVLTGKNLVALWNDLLFNP